MRMDSSFDITAMGMKAQMERIQVLSANIANVNTTRSPEGGPYRRRDVLFTETPLEGSGHAGSGVKVSEIVEDQSPFLRKYDPQHPDAGPDGYVSFPNVNVIAEMVNLQEAARSYEANLSVVLAVKNMVAKTFEIGR